MWKGHICLHYIALTTVSHSPLDAEWEFPNRFLNQIFLLLIFILRKHDTSFTDLIQRQSISRGFTAKGFRVLSKKEAYIIRTLSQSPLDLKDELQSLEVYMAIRRDEKEMGTCLDGTLSCLNLFSSII